MAPVAGTPAGVPELGVRATLSFYLYGDQAAATVARETPLWQAWVQERFAAGAEVGSGG